MYRVLLVGGDGRFLTKDQVQRDKETRDIFSVVDPQTNAFVRWVVVGGEGERRTWRDPSLWQSWTDYYLSSEQERSVCYVSGAMARLATSHPRSIRREGDGAKLISANDSTGFTFRGRFVEDSEAVGISLEVSHKAHGTLAWLIDRQGYRKGDLAIVAWGLLGEEVIQPTEDLLSLLLPAVIEEQDLPAYTADRLARDFASRIAGYGKAFAVSGRVEVIALDSATPGRLALIYYRDLAGSEYLARVNSWHTTCAWLHRYRYVSVQSDDGKQKYKSLPFVGAPAPSDIAEAAYGRHLDDRLRAATIQRILPCIVEGQPLPRDLVESAVRRAANRSGLEEYEWEKALSIACALYRKYMSNKEEYDMPLDPDRKTRDYLYGRALALAESLERWALNEAGEKRETNAARLMQRFAQHPFSTWYSIDLALAPYKARLGPKANKRLQLIDEVVASITPEDFISDKPLSGEFLLGYHSQREYLRSLHAKDEPTIEETDSQQE
jgi:CRISPR-associated protein Csd1